MFPPTEEHPLRVEFFGSEIEEIRPFRAADQRSLGTSADSLWAPPCRELLLTPAVRHRAKQLAAEYPGLGEVLGKIADGITVEGMEAFAPLLADRMELLFDSLPPGALVVACDPERIRARAADLVQDQPGVPRGLVDQRGRGRRGPDRPGRRGIPADHRGARGRGRQLGIGWWTITPFGTEDPSGVTGPTAASPAQGTAVRAQTAWNDAGRATPREFDEPAADEQDMTTQMAASRSGWRPARRPPTTATPRG